FRPRFFPETLSRQVVEHVVQDNPRLNLSGALRKIETDIFKSLRLARAEFADPNVGILIGSDVLETWSALPGFKEIVKEFRLFVNLDPNMRGEYEGLKRKFSGESRIEFVDLKVAGIRGSDLKEAVLGGKFEKLASLMPPGSAKLIFENRSMIEARGAVFLEDTKIYNRKILVQALKKNHDLFKKDPWIEVMLQNDRYVQDFFLITDWKNEVSSNSFIGLIDAKRGTPLYERLANGAPPWKASLAELGGVDTLAGAREFLSKIGVTEENYVHGLDRVRPVQAASTTRYLYHWAPASKADRMTNALAVSKVAAMRFIHKNQNIGRAFPSLVGRRALYTGQDPFGSMYISSDEIYAKVEKGRRPSVFRIELEPAAHVAILETTQWGNDGIRARVDQPSLDADVILHRNYSGGKLYYEEWIVLNPNAIRRIEKDPPEMFKRASQITREIEGGKKDIELERMDRGRRNWAMIRKLLLGFLGQDPAAHPGQCRWLLQ
ncbi:MAG: hypothetical protein ABL958_09970, partial [Bdellovibrionia bacterium]